MTGISIIALTATVVAAVVITHYVDATKELKSSVEILHHIYELQEAHNTHIEAVKAEVQQWKSKYNTELKKNEEKSREIDSLVKKVKRLTEENGEYLAENTDLLDTLSMQHVGKKSLQEEINKLSAHNEELEKMIQQLQEANNK